MQRRPGLRTTAGIVIALAVASLAAASLFAAVGSGFVCHVRARRCFSVSLLLLSVYASLTHFKCRRGNSPAALTLFPGRQLSCHVSTF